MGNCLERAKKAWSNDEKKSPILSINLCDYCTNRGDCLLETDTFKGFCNMFSKGICYLGDYI